jgi:hypothetical protein
VIKLRHYYSSYTTSALPATAVTNVNVHTKLLVPKIVVGKILFSVPLSSIQQSTMGFVVFKL